MDMNLTMHISPVGYDGVCLRFSGWRGCRRGAVPAAPSGHFYARTNANFST